MKKRFYSTLGSCKDPIFSANDGQYIAGYTVGMFVLDLLSPKMPGMMANATTYNFPIRHKLVNIDPPHKVLYGDPSALDELIRAGKELEKEGVRAIVGACGYFAHYQAQLVAALDVPVFMSSLMQIPWVKSAIKPDQRIGLLCAVKENMTDQLLKNAGVTDLSQIVIGDMEGCREFSAIMEPRDSFNHEILRNEVVLAAEKLVASDPDIGALVLECSDFPPYSYDVQNAVSLPVFDFVTLVNWVHLGVAQKPHFGYL